MKKNNVIRLCALASSITLLQSCIGIKQIGDLNMISNRNVSVDFQKYELLKSYAGSESKKELRKEFKKANSKTLESALDYTVKNTAGGEFIANARVYILFKETPRFLVQGDVWGVKGVEPQIKGWKIGDKVQFKSGFKVYKGTISDLRSGEKATIKLESNGILKDVKYEKLYKDN